MLRKTHLWISYITLTLITTAAYSQNHNVYQFSFKPKAHCELELNYTYYDLCYSLFHKQALWAIHELQPQFIKGNQERTNIFKSDSRLKDPVSPTDYRRSGYNRGHLVPAADMKLNHTSMSETFYMTNISPQNPKFNSGVWNALEGYIRNQVLTLGAAIIITAPVLIDNLKYHKISKAITVPHHYYKIAYFYQSQIMKAYLIPNQPALGQKFSEFQVTVDEIEDLTQIDFFTEIEDTLENLLESQI